MSKDSHSATGVLGKIDENDLLSATQWLRQPQNRLIQLIAPSEEVAEVWRINYPGCEIILERRIS